MYSTYVLISLACAIACFLLAKEKGWNPIVWFFGGLFLSGLAILAVLFIKKRHQ